VFVVVFVLGPANWDWNW